MEKIFDKDTIQEKQELAALFGELAYNQIHEISKRAGWKDADPRKATLHAIVGGIMAKLGDGNFLAGASGAAVNELMQKELSKIKDPALHQWASAAVGAAVGGMTGGKTGAQSGAGTAASGTRHNGLDSTEQERLVELLRDAEDNTTRVAILEEAIALSLENKAACSNAEEYMEKKIINALKELRKYETAGVYFEADPEQGMHNNLVAAKQFLLLDKYASCLPEFFGGVVIASAATMAAPVPIISGALLYGDTIYELASDIKKLDKKALIYDLKKNIVLNVSERGFKASGIPKYIIIPVAAGIKVYINHNYKRKGKKERKYFLKK